MVGVYLSPGYRRDRTLDLPSGTGKTHIFTTVTVDLTQQSPDRPKPDHPIWNTPMCLLPKRDVFSL